MPDLSELAVVYVFCNIKRSHYFYCCFLTGADGCGSTSKPGSSGQPLTSSTDPPPPLKIDANTIKENEPTNAAGSAECV